MRDATLRTGARSRTPGIVRADAFGIVADVLFPQAAGVTAPTLYGSTGTTVSGATDISLAPPAGSTGKYALAFLETTDSESITTPTGWTLIETGDDGNAGWRLYSRFLASSSSVTWAGSYANKKALVIYVFDGVDTTTPVDTIIERVYSGASTTRAIPLTVTTGVRGAVTFIGSRGSVAPTTWTTPPQGWTEGADAYNTSSGATTAAGAFRTYPAGLIGGGNWISDTAETRAVVLLVTLNPPAGGGGDVTFTTLVGDATADGGSAAFTAAAVFTTSTAEAGADGGTGAFTADGVFATSEGSATADGGTGTFSGGGGVSFDTLPGDATADGGTGTFRADGVLTTVEGAATADGGSTSFTAAATFATTAGSAAADGGTGTFTADGLITTLTGTAVADGGTATFTAAAVFATTPGDALADGSGATFLAGGVFVTATAAALADGGTGTFGWSTPLIRVPKVVKTVSGAQESRTIRPGSALSATLTPDPDQATLSAHPGKETLSGASSPRRTL